MASTTTARQTQFQQEHYLRFAVNFNDVGISSGVAKQTLPAGAVITSTSVYIGAAFNAVTTNVLTVGTNDPTTLNNIVAAADVDETVATTLTNGIKPTGTALGALTADAIVYVKYTQTGTAATTGSAIVIIKYTPNNDL